MSYFRVESLGTFGSSDIFGSADQPANEATIFHGVEAANCAWNREGELSLFNNEFVLFCIDNQAQVSVHLAKSCSERVLEIFDAVRGFYINSAPEIMEPFVWW